MQVESIAAESLFFMGWQNFFSLKTERLSNTLNTCFWLIAYSSTKQIAMLAYSMYKSFVKRSK